MQVPTLLNPSLFEEVASPLLQSSALVGLALGLGGLLLAKLVSLGTVVLDLDAKLLVAGAHRGPDLGLLLLAVTGVALVVFHVGTTLGRVLAGRAAKHDGCPLSSCGGR